MSRPEQVLNLDPSTELRFRGPFTDVVTSTLSLSNPTNRRVCFKVKTTAPKRYCVRPNSGIIEPGTVVSVAVMLQPFDYDPNEKNKHKFMVQTMYAPDGPIESQENLWKDISPDQLMDSKLKCVFELPLETTQNNLDASGGSQEANITASTSPAKPDSPKASNVDVDIRRTLEENRRLTSELHRLRQENSNLRMDGVRARKLMQSETESSTPATNQMTVGDSNGTALPPIVYLIAAVILGLIIGKFIL